MALLDKTGISDGSLIRPEHITRLYDTLNGEGTYEIKATGSFSGSLNGTASFAVSSSRTVSASFSATASYVANALNATTAGTATNANNIAVTDTVTGTGPYYITFVDASTGNDAVRVDSTSLTYNATTNTIGATASYAVTASYVANAGAGVSSSYAVTASHALTTGATNAISSSYAVTASYVANAGISSSYAVSSSRAGIAASASIINTQTDNAVYYITFVEEPSGNEPIRVDSNVLTYNPSTNIMTTTSSYAVTASYVANATSFPYTGNASITGSLGVAGTFNVTTTAIAGATESLARFTVTDDPTSYFRVYNATAADNSFVPALEGKNSGNTVALYTIGNGATDAFGNLSPCTVFDSRIGTAAVVNRPLFDWRNAGTTVMTLDAAGDLGINKTTANAKLDVNGNAIITGSLTVTNICYVTNGISVSGGAVVTGGIVGDLQGTATYATNVAGWVQAAYSTNTFSTSTWTTAAYIPVSATEFFPQSLALKAKVVLTCGDIRVDGTTDALPIIVEYNAVASMRVGGGDATSAGTIHFNSSSLPSLNSPSASLSVRLVSTPASFPTGFNLQFFTPGWAGDIGGQRVDTSIEYRVSSVGGLYGN